MIELKRIFQPGPGEASRVVESSHPGKYFQLWAIDTKLMTTTLSKFFTEFVLPDIHISNIANIVNIVLINIYFISLTSR